MRFFWKTARYTLLYLKRNEDIREELLLKSVENKIQKINVTVLIMYQNVKHQNSKINQEDIEDWVGGG